MKILPAVSLLSGTLLLVSCFDLSVENVVISEDRREDSSVTAPSTTWYVDADGDGFGSENDDGTASTNQPEGFVDNNTDCDDTDGSINPDAAENNTNPADLNCNGEIGEAPFIVGEYGPAGGFVFQTDGINGLEVASGDVNINGETEFEWGCFDEEVTNISNIDLDEISQTIGKGAEDTQAILNNSPICKTGRINNEDGIIAAAAAVQYSQNGFNDWFLPSIGELNQLYDNRDDLNMVFGRFYWSSSQKAIFSFTSSSSNQAWSKSFSNLDLGKSKAKAKDSIYRVLAVRAF